MTAADAWSGWIPLFVRGARAQVEWAYMGGERFVEPFCHDTLQRLALKPFNQLFRRTTGLDLLRERACHAPGLPLRGIVFHMSRCGSTLAAQWLAALPDSVVLAEPEPLTTLLQWTPPAPGEETVRALLAAMGQPRRDDDCALYVKADCLHMLYIDRLLAAFPGTPWIFLYREPVEVLVSHQRSPVWMQMLETMLAGGICPPGGFGHDPEENIAWMLANVMAQAARAMDRHGNGLLLNYAELPGALENMAGHFGIDTYAVDGKTAAAVVGRNAKHGSEAFRPDSADKRAAADDRIRDVAARWLDEPYRVLERMRLESQGGA